MGAEALDEKIAEWMTKSVVTISEQETVGRFLELVSEHAIHGMPVTKEGGTVSGVLSMTDVILSQFSEMKRPGFYSSDLVCPIIDNNLGDIIYRQVGDLMSRDVISVRSDESLKKAAKLMAERDIQRLLVLDGETRLVGVISSSDLLRALVREG